MLVHSKKPQVLRLHNLEQRERQKFRAEFTAAISEILPSAVNRKIHASPVLRQMVSCLPDLYYTLTTLLFCRRRLGEEYTYIAMYKKKHFEQQGVLLNRKTRLLLFVLEIVGRNLLLPLLGKLMDGQLQPLEGGSLGGRKRGAVGMWALLRRLREGVSRWMGTAQELMSNVEWLILMVYMLGWNKYFTFLETLLGISYVYTYKNDQIREVSYAVEGYLLLATFVIKAIKIVYSAFANKDQQPINKSHPQPVIKPPPSGVSEAPLKQKTLCRICYDQLKDRSSTKCGHVFCWSCIVQSLEMSGECPVCRAACLPREVVQLRNG